MDAISRITEYFTKFPGIGPRQAKRFAYFLLSKDPSFMNGLSDALRRLQKEMAQCPSCFCFFEQRGSGKFCDICTDTARDPSSLLIIEKDVDLENIHKTGIWNGSYFLLGGTVPILEKDPSKKIRSKELFDIVQERARAGTLREIVFATSANIEGENTVQYLTQILTPLVEKYSLKITELGRGLSTGTELEYSDSDTLKNAITNRR